LGKPQRRPGRQKTFCPSCSETRKEDGKVRYRERERARVKLLRCCPRCSRIPLVPYRGKPRLCTVCLVFSRQVAAGRDFARCRTEGYRAQARARCRARGGRYRSPRPRPCVRCGEEWMCFGSTYYQRRRICPTCAPPPAPRERTIADEWPVTYLASCAWCDMHFIGRAGSTYCSEQCVLERQLSEGRAKTRPVPRTCACGARVVGQRVKCDSCRDGAERERNREARRRAKQRRRARMRQIPYERYTLAGVAERDGFACGICQRPVEIGLEVPDPGAPTVDHVWPLARGGRDVLANVQLAHFLCNSWKADRTMAELPSKVPVLTTSGRSR